MAEKQNQEAEENQQALTADEIRAKHNLKLDSLVSAKKARNRRHAQFLVSAGILKP